MQLDWWKTATIHPFKLTISCLALLGAVAELILAFIYNDAFVYLLCTAVLSILLFALEMIEARKFFRKHRRSHCFC